jgi:APA family basic amino acid/polyamine antiporter
MFASQDRLGSAALQTVFGALGATIMAVLIMISTFGCNNGIILAGGRLFEAMANDKLFFKKAAETNANGVPSYSLLIQGIWAIALCFSGSYSTLLDFTVFAILLFYFLTVISVFKKRLLQESLPMSQKILFGAYLTILVLIAGNLMYVKTVSSTIGLFLVLLGIPFYYVMKRNQRI